jgi:hypothetical protein
LSSKPLRLNVDITPPIMSRFDLFFILQVKRFIFCLRCFCSIGVVDALATRAVAAMVYMVFLFYLCFIFGAFVLKHAAG